MSQLEAAGVNPTSCPPPAPEVLLQMIMGYWVSQSIYAAAKLNLADHLAQGAKSYQDLASLTQTHAPSLYRLLRALASVGVFTETTLGTFQLTAMGQYLRRDCPGSLQAISILMGDPEHYSSWGHIVQSIKTGESAFAFQYGMNIFDYYAQNPEPAAIFDAGMTGFSIPETQAILASYDFSGIETLVDVGGGHGRLMISILAANPHLKGIVFDQDAVIEGAKAAIAAAGLSDRCQAIGGNFFDSVPTGADAYILKHIVHDWDDERSLKILSNCRQAIRPGGKVLLAEQVIPLGNDPFMGKLLDVNMLVMCPGGKERTADEYQTLYTQSGFTFSRIVPTPLPLSIVEGYLA